MISEESVEINHFICLASRIWPSEKYEIRNNVRMGALCNMISDYTILFYNDFQLIASVRTNCQLSLLI